MGRPRQYPDDVSRKRAQRERERLGGETSPQESPPEEEVPGEALSQERPPSPGRILTEEAYVADALEQTLAHVVTLRAPEKISHEAIRQRLDRAEAYARWRFRAHAAGEVFSL